MILYNEIEPFAATWLKNLAAADLVPAGLVDERSIEDIEPGDLADAIQFHAFAGIGGWPLALRMAGWPDDLPVWTGSCPCQPFSTAGRQKGMSDERHLWPTWFDLIRECRPPVVFGEQVASKAGLAWFDSVSADLEGAGYAVGAADLCAASVGAPHIRQRLYFVAVAYSDRLEGIRLQLQERRPQPGLLEATRRGENSQLGHAGRTRARRVDSGIPGAEASDQRQRNPDRSLGDVGQPPSANSSVVGDARGPGLEEREGERGDAPAQRAASERTGQHFGVGDAAKSGRTEGSAGGRAARKDRTRSADGSSVGDADGVGERRNSQDLYARQPESSWTGCDWILCNDPKRGEIYRPVEPGTHPLAHGVPGRVGLLRGYGNAIVPEVATAFIESFIEIISE